MSDKPIGLGFIGCGKHARRSHAAVIDPNEFRIVARYDPDPNSLRAMAELAPPEFIRADSADELLALPEVRAVVIATPPCFHPEYLQKAVVAGKHVLCEKPLWSFLPHACPHAIHKVVKVNLESAKEKGLVVTSCHPRRFDHEYQRLRMKMLAGLRSYGEVKEFNFTFFYHKPPEGWRKEDSLLLDHLNHEVDLARYILGPSPMELFFLDDAPDQYRVFGKRKDGIALSFRGYRTLESLGAKGDGHFFHNELQVVFATGRVTIPSLLNSKVGLVRSAWLEENLDQEVMHRPLEAFSRQDAADPFKKIMHNFAEAIRGRVESYLSHVDMLYNSHVCNVLLAEKVYRDEDF